MSILWEVNWNWKPSPARSQDVLELFPLLRLNINRPKFSERRSYIPVFLRNCLNPNLTSHILSTELIRIPCDLVQTVSSVSLDSIPWAKCGNWYVILRVLSVCDEVWSHIDIIGLGFKCKVKVIVAPDWNQGMGFGLLFELFKGVLESSGNLVYDPFYLFVILHISS